MKKTIFMAFLVSIFSCTPFQRMILSPVNRNRFLNDSCDLMVINRLKQALDSAGYDNSPDQSPLLEYLMKDPSCDFYASKFYPPLREDSSIWFMTIRPADVGKDEIIVGNLYTFAPKQESTFTFYRRVKEYSQKEDFESGKYVVFTYFVENDSITIIKAGKKRY